MKAHVSWWKLDEFACLQEVVQYCIWYSNTPLPPRGDYVIIQVPLRLEVHFLIPAIVYSEECAWALPTGCHASHPLFRYRHSALTIYVPPASIQTILPRRFCWILTILLIVYNPLFKHPHTQKNSSNPRCHCFSIVMFTLKSHHFVPPRLLFRFFGNHGLCHLPLQVSSNLSESANGKTPWPFGLKTF